MNKFNLPCSGYQQILQEINSFPADSIMHMAALHYAIQS